MSTDPLRVALAQMNSTVGDLAGNAAQIAELTGRARERGAALVVFPELALTGYPPEDLLLKTRFLTDAAAALNELAASTGGIVSLVGYPESAGGTRNAAALLAGGEVVATYHKICLPNYGVFDERRYFVAGADPATFRLNGVTVGITICEDIWDPGLPPAAAALAGAELIVNLSASPYHRGKGLERERMLARRARESHAAVLLCNAVGGQDELVFDGHSVALDREGELLARAPQFEPALLLCDVQTGRRERGGAPGPAGRVASLEVPSLPSHAPAGGIATPLPAVEEMYAALRTGVRDYVQKNGFEGALLGLSGGIDSALVALLAVDALGPERVTCVVMPSPYSSRETQSDARAIASALGATLVELGIEGPIDAYERLLREPFAGRAPDVTEENLQARIRGNLLMALSNKFGRLVLTTGNKSELSVGYATLYGDMAGGFAVLKDVFKQSVYALVEWRNGLGTDAPVPPTVLTRPPSAELRPDQRDDQSLPPYAVLDAILGGYVEQDLDAAEIIQQGHAAGDVERVLRLVDHAEYKRRQAPPGIRISTKAFGRDRRLPITNRYEPGAGPPVRRGAP